MRVRSFWALTLLAGSLAVAGCASAPTNTSFDTSIDDRALVIFPGPSEQYIAMYFFRGIDLDQEVTTQASQIIDFNTYLSRNSLGVNGGYDFRIARFAPGDYALTSYYSEVGYSYVSVSEVCYQPSAAVFRFEPGSINILPTLGDRQAWGTLGHAAMMDSPNNQNVLLDTFEILRQSYPGIVGPAEVSMPIAFLSWETAERSGISSWFADSFCPPMDRLDIFWRHADLEAGPETSSDPEMGN